MDKLGFSPIIDFPLAGITLASFIWHFNRWSHRRNLDATVDLVSRLPKARFRVAALFVLLVLLCWSINLAFWSLFAMLLAMGFAFAVVLGGDVEGGAFGLLASAFLIREWAFGFPQLILHPQVRSVATDKDRLELRELVGLSGIAMSSLRPSGDMELGGRKYSVVTYDGGLIEAGSKVVVMSIRDGRLCVALASDVVEIGSGKEN